MYSYKNAYGKLPETEDEMEDAIKIANGRFPSVVNETAERKAKELFVDIYKRIPDTGNVNDNAAVKVMAYGLRQIAKNRNLESEKTGINSFKLIFGHLPITTEDWNVMQAITYSGAIKQLDSDKDLLSDQMEKKYNTDPNIADSDGDGFLDGLEILNGYSPKGKGKLE